MGCPDAPQTWATISGRHQTGFSSPYSTTPQPWNTSSTPTYLWLTWPRGRNLWESFWIIQDLLMWELWGSLSPAWGMQHRREARTNWKALCPPNRVSNRAYCIRPPPIPIPEIGPQEGTYAPRFHGERPPCVARMGRIQGLPIDRSTF